MCPAYYPVRVMHFFVNPLRGINQRVSRFITRPEPLRGILSILFTRKIIARRASGIVAIHDVPGILRCRGYTLFKEVK
jgi:hypothetical protein